MTLSPLLGAAIPVPSFPPSETAVLESLQSAIDTVIGPAAAQTDAVGRYPTASVAALKASGILALAVPTQFGGIGSGHRASLEAQVRLGMADSSVAQIFKIHDELVREIFVYCPDALRPVLAAQIVSEQMILGLAVAEAGRKVDDPWNTTAIAMDVDGHGGGYVIEGQKIYTTGAAEADLLAVWAFDPTAPDISINPLLGFVLNLLPRGTRGVEIHRDWDAMGQRGTDSGTVTFAGVLTEPAWRASIAGRAPLLQNSVRYQAGFAAVLVGIGLGAVAAATPFVRHTSRPWPSAGVDSAADDPMVRRLCGELVAQLSAAYAMTMCTGDLLDSFEVGDISRTELAVPIYSAKACASTAALRATGEIHALMGTRSAARSTGFDRYWRNARVLSLHDPVDWKHEEIGRHVLTGWDPPPGIYT